MKKRIKRSLLVVGVLLVIFFTYQVFREYHHEWAMLFHSTFNHQTLMHSVRSHGLSASIVLILLTCVTCAVPGLPTSVVGVFVGVCYGPLIGSTINIIGNTLGNIMSLTILQKFELFDRNNTNNKWVQSITKMKHPRVGITIAYMIPFIPSFLVNFTSDYLNLDAKTRYLCIILGVTPSSILYAFGGDSLFKGNHKRAILFIISVTILTLLIIIIKKDQTKKHIPTC